MKDVRSIINMLTESNDPVKNKVAQQLLKALMIVRNLAIYLDDVMKTLFIAAEQFNDVKVFRIIIRDGLV